MFGGPVISRAVQHSRDLERVLRIPRRTWSDQDAATFARDLSAVLRKPTGTMDLRPIQAMALYEMASGGLLGPIGVGQGKTLISLLAPFVMGSRRPLLLTRANLIEKTKRDWRALSAHWPIPNFIRIESFDKLGRANHAQLLDQYRPDLIVADECHRLKNRKAAVTRRVHRYMDQNPGTGFVAISGTITRKSLLEWAHLAVWCLRDRAPVPFSHSDLEDWADALDEKPTGDNPVQPGALFFLCNAEERAESDPLNAVRTAFRRRLVETHGVIASAGNYLGSSLSIQGVETDVSPEMDQAFSTLRTQWITPDGWPISDPMALNRHARELALGFFYVWDPRPPTVWLDARKEWSKACREILASNRRHLDSELQVIQAVDAGHYPEAAHYLATWRMVKPSFVPNTVPVWFDYSALEFAGDWAAKNVGIVWTEHVAFAEALAARTRLPYYGQKGLDRLGRYIEDHPGDQSMIAGVDSNSDGKNLQKWAKNLIVSPEPNAQICEQVIGRTHRPGQDSDEVSVDVLFTCYEHVDALNRAIRQAEYVQTSTGQPQKLCYGDVAFPDVDDVITRGGPRWTK